MTKPKVFITRQIPPAAIDIIARSCEYRVWPDADTPIPRPRLLQEVRDVDGIFSLLTERIDGELMDAAPRCKVVANMAAGYDNIAVPELTARGVLVTHTPGVLTETTADLTFALILATARRLFEANRYLLDGGWKTWSPMLLTGQDVHGATLGIIGCGRIGAAVARRAKGFGMKLLYANRKPDPELESELGMEYRSMDELLRDADIVSILVPLSPETRHLIGDRELSLMKPTAILINSARGPIVDEQALHRALVEKRIWAAGLDVFEVEPVPLDNPLLHLDNVVALPHIGSASIATRTKMATLAATNLVVALRGERPPNLVNPDAWPPRGNRVTPC